MEAYNAERLSWFGVELNGRNVSHLWDFSKAWPCTTLPDGTWIEVQRSLTGVWVTAFAVGGVRLWHESVDTVGEAVTVVEDARKRAHQTNV
jgi:hypothetical protein